MKSELIEQIVSLKNQGYSHAQIANTLNVSKATVSRYLKKAKQQNENKTKTETSETIETKNETNEIPETSETKTETNETFHETPETLEKFLEDKNTNLKIVTPQDVVKDLNSRITLVKSEPTNEENQKDKNPVSKIKEKITVNKYLIAIMIITAIGAAIGLYTLFRHRKSENDSERSKNEPAKEVVEAKKDKLHKKSLKVKTPYGYVEEKLNQPDNVAIL